VISPTPVRDGGSAARAEPQRVLEGPGSSPDEQRLRQQVDSAAEIGFEQVAPRASASGACGFI